MKIICGGNIIARRNDFAQWLVAGSANDLFDRWLLRYFMWLSYLCTALNFIRDWG